MIFCNQFQSIVFLKCIFKLSVDQMEQNTQNNNLLDFSHDPITTPSIHYCPNHHFATYICNTEGCTSNALICNQQQCECTQFRHNKCKSKITIQQCLANIQKHKRQVPVNIKIIFESIIQQYNRIINKLSQDRLQFIGFTNRFGLTQNMIQVIKVLNDGDEHNIDGNLVHNIYDDSTKKIPYFPLTMTNHNIIRDCQVQINYLLNKLCFDLLTQSQEKTTKALVKFYKKDFNTNQIIYQNEHLEFIPIQITLFSQLRILNLSYNQIRVINDLSNQIVLQQLNLYSNDINEINGLDKLTILKKLDLGVNKIVQIKNLDNLTNLRQLFLSYNNITEIGCIQKLISLKQLDLRSNPLQNSEDAVNILNNMKLQNLYLSIKQQI